MRDIEMHEQLNMHLMQQLCTYSTPTQVDVPVNNAVPVSVDSRQLEAQLIQFMQNIHQK